MGLWFAFIFSSLGSSEGTNKFHRGILFAHCKPPFLPKKKKSNCVIYVFLERSKLKITEIQKKL